jgi:methionyl-tRNA formyltransferase
MRVAIIGRTEVLYDTAIALREAGHDVVCIITAREAPEYLRTADDFRLLANDWGIPFAKGARIIEHSTFLASARADIAVSINFTAVVPQSIVDLFPFGVLNAHGGDLPRYRGNACQAWAILNGEQRIGLCIHKMVGGELDSGPIIAREYLSIDHTTKITTVWEWMRQRTPSLMVNAVSELSQDPSYCIEWQSADPKAALRCYPRLPEDGQIEWSKSSIDVLRLINASNKPYQGAFCSFEGHKLVIWDAELVNDGEQFCAVPGQVVEIGQGYIDIVCGNGKLRLRKVQIEGGDECEPNIIIGSIRKRLC